MLIVGLPSADKTQTVLQLKGAPNTFYLDTLTENSLLSGYQPPDSKRTFEGLLPQLDGKCLIIKDLTTFLSMRDDKVGKILGDFQSVYEGEYIKATGTVGVLPSQSRFTLLGCVTPMVLTKHYMFLARIGPRFLCYRVPELTKEERKKGYELILRANKRKAIESDLRRLIAEHSKELLDSPVDLMEETPEQEQALTGLGELLACGRGWLAGNDL
jgi:hypothetical protein